MQTWHSDRDPVKFLIETMKEKHAGKAAADLEKLATHAPAQIVRRAVNSVSNVLCLLHNELSETLAT